MTSEHIPFRITTAARRRIIHNRRIVIDPASSIPTPQLSILSADGQNISRTNPEGDTAAIFASWRILVNTHRKRQFQ